MIKSIDGAVFSRMMLSAAAEIDLNKQKVNELNVFPVPDGDTGTNMSMTLNAASTELRRAENVTLTKAADMTASALLRGARGNSGVILSLLFRGFSKALKGKLGADGRDFAAALTAGVEAAYKAVMKPAEGTILTVSRLTADAARDLAEENCEIEYVLQHCLDTAHAALDNTVNQNPVLKKAGVVDAGGMGFCLILRGMLESLRGNDVVCEDTGAANEEADFGIFDSEDITFAFDTVFIVRKREDITSLDPLREYLGSIGDSLVIGEDDEAFKVHVHTLSLIHILELSVNLEKLPVLWRTGASARLSSLTAPVETSAAPYCSENSLRIAGKIDQTLVAFIIHFMGRILATKR